jgi:CDP-paratose 2-epimerase
MSRLRGPGPPSGAAFHLSPDALFPTPRGTTLITGGAGFIGTNLAHRLLSQGVRVLIYDNLSRAGVESNLRWLTSLHGDLVEVEVADVRDAARVRSAVSRASQVFHLAAQVAVTTSLDRPMEDFEINVRGTLNVLEAARSALNPPSLVFTSTNKVYGDLADLSLVRSETRYEPADPALRAHGVAEDRPLEFHSPYGCSKGAADQYVLDYARTYGLPAAVFRMSCIYGPHQFGTEDQGWVAHFLIRALAGDEITLYGDGRQVRDLLHVQDLFDAFLLAQRHMPEIAGHAFNMGGGAENTVSLLELVGWIGELAGERPEVRFSGWRTGDQKYFVSDSRRFRRATGWSPRVSARRGVEALHGWLVEERIRAAPRAPIGAPEGAWAAHATIAGAP